MTPTKLQLLKLSRIRREKRGQKNVLEISSIIGRSMGESKNSEGGWNDVKRKPKDVSIFDNDEMDGLVNIYKDVNDHLFVTENIYMKIDNNDRLFDSINGKATSDFPMF